MKKKALAALGLAGLLAAAAGFYFKRKQKAEADGTAPPKNAPQLHIENPGDQSEFPAAPGGDRELG